MSKAFLCLGSLLVFLSTSCRGQTSLSSSGSSCENPVELQVLEQGILRLIDTPSCQQTSQCRSIAFGAKPCGGPWRYLVYSTAHVDPAALGQRVSQYNELNDRLNRECGWVSDCALVGEPALACREGACVALSQSP